MKQIQQLDGLIWTWIDQSWAKRWRKGRWYWHGINEPLKGIIMVRVGSGKLIIIHHLNSNRKMTIRNKNGWWVCVYVIFRTLWSGRWYILYLSIGVIEGPVEQINANRGGLQHNYLQNRLFHVCTKKDIVTI